MYNIISMGKELSSRAMNFSLTPFPEDGAEPMVDGTCLSWEDITRLALLILLLTVLVGLRVYQLLMELKRLELTVRSNGDWLSGRPAVSNNAMPFKAPGHPGK
ncbi:uncharacterized protein LOC129587376 isoform X2 [Paramacrobiotus metropolitanus]|uniref:uncharacterized protein LOC129587376 isoform X2 n=1 Tax=Paramacrobiotus metropolitanus TaxID=2943436 RepID=UPI002446293E|nr:uncharacterized protein LOC129587376 isoform X2 [Paramacrobiotus metropolitanus]